MLLLDLLAETVETLGDLDESEDAPSFAEMLLEARPDAFAGFTGGPTGQTAHDTALRLAEKHLELIKEIRPITVVLSKTLLDKSAPPAARLTLAAVLAYLVQPLDLMPDDLPGGFGYVDDCILMRTALVKFPFALPRGVESVAREELAIIFLGMCVPRTQVAAFRRAVEGIWALAQTLRFMPERMVGKAVRGLLDNPLEPIAPPSARVGPEVPELPDVLRLPEGRVELGDGGATICYCIDRARGVSLDDDRLVPLNPG